MYMVFFFSGKNSALKLSWEMSYIAVYIARRAQSPPTGPGPAMSRASFEVGDARKNLKYRFSVSLFN